MCIALPSLPLPPKELYRHVEQPFSPPFRSKIRTSKSKSKWSTFPTVSLYHCGGQSACGGSEVGEGKKARRNWQRLARLYTILDTAFLNRASVLGNELNNCLLSGLARLRVKWLHCSSFLFPALDMSLKRRVCRFDVLVEGQIKQQATKPNGNHPHHVLTRGKKTSVPPTHNARLFQASRCQEKNGGAYASSKKKRGRTPARNKDVRTRKLNLPPPRWCLLAFDMSGPSARRPTR